MKILWLSDHCLSTSGCGTQSRFIVDGLVKTGKFSVRCFGGAIRHEDYSLVKVSDDFIIKPTDGYGTPEMLRYALATERPDALVLFTDPRFFIWVFQMEEEIHQICPVIYNHLWDNLPYPSFNAALYDSTDYFNCINWPTYQMLKEHYPNKTNYVPHALPRQVYFPYSPADREKARSSFFGQSSRDMFVMLWVSRNAHRKKPNDILASWKLFLTRVAEKYGDEAKKKCIFVMHTDPKDNEGPDLLATTAMFKMQENVVFSTDRVGFEHMCMLYNAVDFVINRSCAEGFGLPTLEAMMCGRPIVALKTGGMTKQVLGSEGENGIALPVECRSLVGSQQVPYIYEDFVTIETTADAIMKMYEMGPEEREKLGQRALRHATANYAYENMISEWDRTLSGVVDEWKRNRERLYRPWELISL